MEMIPRNPNSHMDNRMGISAEISVKKSSETAAEAREDAQRIAAKFGPALYVESTALCGASRFVSYRFNDLRFNSPARSCFFL